MNDNMKKPAVIAAALAAIAVFLPWITFGEHSASGFAALQDHDSAARFLFALPLLGGVAAVVLAFMEKTKEMDIATLVAGAGAVAAFAWTMSSKPDMDGVGIGFGAYIGVAAGAAIVGLYAKEKMDEKNG